MYYLEIKKILNSCLRQYSLTLIFAMGILYSQEVPEEFDFNQSIYQSFYFFITSDMDGEALIEGEDWIASFNEYDETMDGQCSYIDQDLDGNSQTYECQDVNDDGVLSQSIDVCVGSFVWSGAYTTVPVMGADGTRWTAGYMKGPEPFVDCNEDQSICDIDDEWESSMGNGDWDAGEFYTDANGNGQWDDGQLPKFRIYDASENSIYHAVPSVVYPWSTDLAFYVISISVFRDCNEDLGGSASIDNCGECTGGETGLDENYLDIGCGCNNEYIGPFYEDADGDGLGAGEEQFFCENPGLGWSENNMDPEPDCSANYFDCNNECGGTSVIDECGECGGNNDSQDCAGVCSSDEDYGAYYDECDDCVGGSTGIEPCDFESNQPDEFIFEQSTMQAFYLVYEAEMWDGELLSNQDWLGAFHGDVCVGSVKWDGLLTTIPVMGDDGSSWTEGYLNLYDQPTFKFFDASVDAFYDIEIVSIETPEGGEYIGFVNLAFYDVDILVLSQDCNGDASGSALIDDCEICSGGETGLEFNENLDCAGICFGSAEIDNCGICAGGTTDNIPNVNDLGCGCFFDGPQDYYSDIDNDGFGSGDAQSFCDNPGDGWSTNNLDVEPFCFNEDISVFNVDDCGVCNGGNEDIDCSGICFGIAELDECGVCEGDNSICQSPTVQNFSFTSNEDDTLSITLSGSDPNNLELSFVITVPPSHGILIGDSGDLSHFNYISNENYNGTDSFLFMAYNGSFYSNEAEASININSVNDAPLANHIIAEVSEDSHIDINLIGSDIDGDAISFSIASDASNGTTLLMDEVLRYTPNEDYSGTDEISYVSNDGELESEIAIVSISVIEINDAPVAQNMEITFYEDNVYNFSFDASDVESSDDELTVFINNDIEFGAITLNGLNATISPTPNLNGDFYLEYMALDGLLFSESAILTIHILPVNDAPIMSTIINQSIDEDTEFYYMLSASDIDEDSLTFSVEEIDNADLTITDQSLLVAPENDFNGELLIEISVSDGEYSDIETFILDVLPVNDPPVLSSIDNQSSLEDQIFVIDIIANDVDGDNLSYLSNSSPNADISFSGNQLSVMPNEDWFGDITISVNVTDGEYMDSDEFILTILPSNDMPVISEIDNQSIEEDSSFSYTIEAFDADGDNLEYSVEETSNATSYIENDMLLITPNQDYYGTIQLNVSVSDSEFSSSTAFDLEIIPVNDPPVLGQISNQFIMENQVLELEFNAYDVDNEILNYSYYISAGYGSVEFGEDLLVITPNQNWAGELIITLIIDDGEYSAQEELMVGVVAVDDPPVAYSVSSTTSEDQNITIDLISSDSDTDTESLTYSILTQPLHGDASVVGSSIEYSPSSDYNGDDELFYNVNDGNSTSDPASITINIVPVNDPPTAEDIEFTMGGAESLEFDLNSSINDIDGDNLEISFITQNYGSETISTLFDGEIVDLGDNIFSYSPPSEMAYFDFILYKATDDVSESSLQTITFNLFGREMPRDMAPIAFNQDVSTLEDESVDLTLIGFDVLNAFSDDAYFEITSHPGNGQLSPDFSILESGTPNLAQWLIEYTPNADYFGQDSVVYKVINPDNSIAESENGIIYITISPQNDSPIIYLTMFDQILTEDSSGNELDLNSHFFDVDNDSLSYDITLTNSDIIDASIIDNILSIVPIENQSSDPFSATISANDGELEVSQTFFIEVLSVNDPPTAYSSEYTMDEDNLITIILSGTDPEFDPLSYTIYENPDNGFIELSANVVSYLPSQDFNGLDSFRYRVNDGELNSNVEIISLTINPINDAPVLSDIEEQSINEDSIFEFAISANDVDGDSLVFSVEIDDDVENYEVSGNNLTITPIEHMNGTLEVSITVSDNLLSNSLSFLLQVISQPDPPELTQIDDQEVNEDENFLIFLSASDVDGDELFYYGDTDVEGTLVTVDENLLIVDPPQDYFGEMSVMAGVSDSLYDITDIFVINFIPQPDPPQIEPISDQEVLEAHSITVDVNAYDPDGDEINLSVDISDDINVTINEHQIVLQSQNNVSGLYEVFVTASDGEYTDQDLFILNVINVNDPPVSYSDSFILDEDNDIILILNAEDPDFDNLTYHIQSYPSFGSINVINEIATYTPALNYNGLDSFSFYANDAEEPSNISIISLEILPVNDGPVITSSPPLSAVEDELYAYEVIAEDPDDEVAFFNLNSFPDGMEINDSGLITWTPLEGILTSGEIVLAVSDEGEDGALPFTQTFIIEVEPVNDRPIITSTPDAFAYEDIEYSYQIEVYDSDSDTFYYDLLIAPDGLELTDDGVITWTPTEGITSSGTVAFVVWDVESPNPLIDLPAVQEFVITVIPVNDPPVIISTPSPNAIEDIEYLYHVEVEDVDDDIFFYSLISAPEGMIINENSGILTWTPQEGVFQSGDITINVVDGFDEGSLGTIQTFAISVTPVNDSPIIISIAPTSAVQGEEYLYQILIDDPDDNNFNYLLYNHPNGMSIDFSTGILSWTPETGGVYGPITLRVQDGGEDYATASEEIFSIFVQYAFGPTTIVIPIHSDANLISYSAIPEDNTIENVLSDLENNVMSIITESSASTFNPNFGWVGNLDNIEPDKGYWLVAVGDEIIGQDSVIYYNIENAIPTPQNFEYTLHEDANLISYLGIDGVSVSDALPDHVEENVHNIIGEGVAAAWNPSFGWVGSLEAFYRNSGYWLINNLDSDTLYFSWEIPEEETLLSRGTISKKYTEIPSNLSYSQSTRQAFYFIERLNLDDIIISRDDWIVAFNNGIIVGARQWNGPYTDIPAMGSDGKDYSYGYCRVGDIPTFKIYIDSTGEMIELESADIAPWSDLSINMISNLNESSEAPESFEISYPYPNPFNPSTSIHFGLPYSSDVKIQVYDILGRHIHTILNEKLDAGYFDINWKPSPTVSTGIYFINVQTKKNDLTYKVMLIK